MLATQIAGGFVRHPRKDDSDFLLARQVVQCRNDVPAVDLGMVELLCAVVQAVEVAQPQRVGSGEKTKRRVRADDTILVREGELAVTLKNGSTTVATATTTGGRPGGSR